MSIQGGEFASLWLLCDDLRQRLRDFDEGATLSYQDSLPLQDYFSLVDDHFALRKHAEALNTELENRMEQ